MKLDTFLLKPCPFCGGATIKGYNKDFDPRVESWIQCFNKDCWAQLKARPYKKAVERWNTRKLSCVKNGWNLIHPSKNGHWRMAIKMD